MHRKWISKSGTFIEWLMLGSHLPFSSRLYSNHRFPSSFLFESRFATGYCFGFLIFSTKS